MDSVKKRYDAIVIGAGIGGLVCGSYLARAGLKTLIVEQHSRPGGYCSSFTRGGYRFDTGVHALVNCRKNGLLGGMIRDLGLNKKFKLMRADPSDIFRASDFEVRVSNDPKETIKSIKRNFRSESNNIEKFIEFITNKSFISLYTGLKDIPFNTLLDRFFRDERLKSFFGMVVINLGLPLSEVSALAAAILVKEHLFDGGYFVQGGMQSFPDACAAVFEDNGGALLFSKKADRIVIRNNKTDGVLLSDDSFIQADFVVSACDARQTFLNLIDETVLSQDFLKKFKGMKPSCSCFGVHLCLGRKISRLADRCRALWVSASPDLESYYDNIKCGIVDDSFSQLLMVFPSRHDSSLAPSGKDYLFSLVNVPYKNEKFWADEKERLAERLIERVKSAVPRLSDYIVERYITTPATFEKYTLNYRGAFRGWESTISQFGSDRMPQRTEVEGLYLAGHWATTNAGQGGISVAAYSGLNAARLLIRDAKNNQDKRKVMVRV